MKSTEFKWPLRAGTTLVVQWLTLHASTAGGSGSIPGWGTKMPQGMAKIK